MHSGAARPLAAIMGIMMAAAACSSTEAETGSAAALASSASSTTTTTTEAPDPHLDVVEGDPPTWSYEVERTTDPVSGARITVVRPSFSGGSHDGKLPLLSSAVDHLVDEVVEQFRADAASADQLAAKSQNFLPSELSLVGDVLLSSPAIVSVEFTVSRSIAGTARPTLDYRSIVWDLPNGVQLHGPDIASDPPSFERLGSLALDRIATLMADAGVARGDLSVQPFLDGFAAVSPTSRGVRVAFGRDELLPGVFGEGAVTTLPWDTVDGLVSPRVSRVAEAVTARGQARPQTRPIVLEATGLDGTAFGAPPDVVIGAVVAVLGPPGDDSGFVPGGELCESPAGPTLRRVQWRSLVLWFTPDGGFRGWQVADGANPVAASTPEGIGLRSTVSAVQAAYAGRLVGGAIRPLFPDDPELTEGLFEAADEAGTVVGVTDTREPDGTVTEMWAGGGCEHLAG